MEQLKDISAKTIENIGYRGLVRFISFGLQALTSVVLAQQLSASDFGIVGFAMIFISFLSSFSDAGIGSAIIQRKNIDDRTLSTGLVVRVALGIVALSGAFAASYIAAISFGDPVVARVIQILSLTFLIGSIGFIPETLLVRALDFKRWVIPVLTATFLRAGFACTLAINGFGFWSIVVADLVSAVTQALLFPFFGKNIKKLDWEWPIAKDLLRFAVPLFSSNLIIFVLFNADNFIIGSVTGAVILGYYALAFNWGSMFSKIVNEVIHSVMFPTLSRLQDNREVLRRTYLGLIEQLAVFGILSYVGLFCCADQFLILILGRGSGKWLPAVNSLRIFCIYGIIRLLLEPFGNVLVALGKTRLIFQANLIAASCEVLAVYPALLLGGIEAVAIVVTLSYAVQWFFYWPTLSKELNLGLSEFFKILSPSLIAGFLGGISGTLLGSFLGIGFGAFSILVVTISVVFFMTQGLLSSWGWAKSWHQFIVTRPKGE